MVKILGIIRTHSCSTLWTIFEKRMVIASIVLIVGACTQIQSAQSQEAARRVTELRQEYFRLRNNDKGKGLERDWQALVSQFVTLLRNIPEGHPERAIVMLDAAFIEYRLWRSGHGDAHAERAKHYLDQVLEDYPAFALQEEAFRLRGDVAAAFERDFRGARKYYKQMNSGEELKNSRILSLVNDTFEELAPAPELPVPDLIPTQFRNAGRRSKLVVIDPGHGGEDSGAAYGDLKEKNITLSLAKSLYSTLVARGFRVHLTRQSDFFLPLVRRTEKANDLKADVFVSLHVNSSPSGDAAGIESYYLDNTDDQSARRLADRENLSGGVTTSGDDLGFMLSDLIQTGKLGDSIRLASTIQGDVIDTLNPRWGPLVNLGVKKAPFYVLVGAHMPCSLVEILFINNPNDSRLLGSTDFRKDAAKAVADGIESYFNRDAVSQSGHKRITQREMKRGTTRPKAALKQPTRKKKKR